MRRSQFVQLDSSAQQKLLKSGTPALFSIQGSLASATEVLKEWVSTSLNDISSHSHTLNFKSYLLFDSIQPIYMETNFFGVPRTPLDPFFGTYLCQIAFSHSQFFLFFN